MKRLFSTVSYLCWLALPGTAAAQSCAKLPTCTELGYTTAAWDCPSELTPLVCPFDNTKVYCPEDCSIYLLSSCDETKGTCTSCNQGKSWKYESCKTGWYLSGHDCVENECSGYPYTTEPSSEAGTIISCQSGTTTKYGYSSCNPGWRQSGYDCIENECPGYNRTNDKICGCETVSSCQKGNNKVYKCDACSVCYNSTDNGLCEEKVNTNAVGDIYCYNNTAIGVVFYNDDNTTKLVGLRNIDLNGQETRVATKLHWSTSSGGTYNYDVDELTNYTDRNIAITDMDGKSNTQKILAYIKANGYEAEAATATSLYAPSVCSEDSFCGVGEWYLPALGELQTMYNNLSTIDRALSNAGGSLMQNFDYWSSTEYGNGIAWLVFFSSGNKTTYGNASTNYVRPALMINNGE